MIDAKVVRTTLACWVVFQGLLGSPAFAVETPALAPTQQQLEAMSLDELLALPIALLSGKTLRDSPAVVTVVTREEIIHSGARDLLDVLNRVAGFSFALDVLGIVGVGFRGSWGQEGKVLLLVDGQEFNDPFYGTSQFGNHFPLDQIEKIEIIRGPGSAIYGGHAALAVININTRSGKDLHGASVSASYGQMARDFGRRTLGLSVGRAFDNGLSVSAAATFGQSNRSDLPYVDLYGGRYDMGGNNRLDGAHVNVGASYAGLRIRYIYDDYRTTNRDGFVGVLDQSFHKDFIGHFGEIAYDLKLGDRLVITPTFQYRNQSPWREDRLDHLDEFFNGTGERFLGRVTGLYHATDSLTFFLGTEGRIDHGRINQWIENAFYAPYFPTFRSASLFGEVSWDMMLANLSAGARYELHSQFGNAFVPRISLTRVINDFHVKLLYSHAFRAPDMMALAENFNIAPEFARSIEAEVGYQINSTMLVTMNAFDTTVEHSIVYFFDVETGKEGYYNGAKSGSRGLELEYRLTGTWYSSVLNYSFYFSKNEVENFAVPGVPGVNLAFPQHKVALNASIRPWAGLVISPSAVFYSTRYGYTQLDSDGNPMIGQLPPLLLANLYVGYRNLGVYGLDAGIGVNNVLDQRDSYIQAYNSAHAPLPGPSREFVVSLTYSNDLGGGAKP